jgi:hypothetical protein
MTASLLTADPASLVTAIVEAFADAPLTRLADVASLPNVPAAYLMGLRARDSRGLYAAPVAARAALYSGSTTALRSRASRYAQRLRRVGLDRADPVVVWLAFDEPVGLGWARLCEVVAQVSLPLMWNSPGPLHGIGSNELGRRRHDPVAPWWRVHSSPPDHRLEAEVHAWWLRHGASAPALLAR